MSTETTTTPELACKCGRGFARPAALALHVKACPVAAVYRDQGGQAGYRVLRRIRKDAPQLLTGEDRWTRKLLTEAVQAILTGQQWPPAAPEAKPADQRRDRALGLRFSQDDMDRLDRAVAAGRGATRSAVIYSLVSALD